MDKNLITSHNPLVTVMMPVRNGEKFIRKAVESILFQTFTDFELLILDDGSTDQTVDIVRSYKDKRIRLIQNDKSLNLAEARQKSVTLSRGKYIAYLDSDDITKPSRLAVQMQFLQKNSDISAVGSWVEIIDEQGNSKGSIWKHTTSPDIIPSILLFRNCFTQSSVLLKKECLLTTPYRSTYWPAPDFDLWTRLSQKYRLANIPKVLTLYRVHKENSSSQKQKEIKDYTKIIFANSLKTLGIIPSDTEIELHDSIERERWQKNRPKDLVFQLQKWLVKLLSANQKTHVYPQNIFAAVVSDYWFKICLSSANNGLVIWNKFINFPMKIPKFINWKQKLILAVFCLLKKSQTIDITTDFWIKMTH